MSNAAPWSERDLQEARLLQRKLREIFDSARPGVEQGESLTEVRRLCDRALLAVDDDFCQHHLCEVERHAEKLFSRGGVMFQRRLILDTLEAIQDRLATMQHLHGAAGALARADIILEKR